MWMALMCLQSLAGCLPAQLQVGALRCGDAAAWAWYSHLCVSCTAAIYVQYNILHRLTTNASVCCADEICRGVYPWEHTRTASNSSSTREQLITQLRTHQAEFTRAQEELELLEMERAQCLAFYVHQQAEIQAAIERTQLRLAALQQVGNVPPCSSCCSRNPVTPADHSAELTYCTGLLILLEQRLRNTGSRLQAARAAFHMHAEQVASDWDAAAARATPADACADEEEEDGAV